MDDRRLKEGSAHRHGLGERLAARVSRRGLVAGGGLAGVGLLASQLELLRSAAQDSAAVAAVMDPLATLEAFAVTLAGLGRQQGDQLKIGADAARFLRAAQCEDEAHYNFLVAAGAEAETTFTFAGRVFRTRASFLSALLDAKEVAVGAAMAAARQFAALGELRLVEIAYQIGAVDAQHLALARLYLGEQIANDRAFAKWRFATTADAAQTLIDAGYLDGKGDATAFPGPLSRQCRGVFGLVPETTEDQEVVGSPVAT
ncbi:MAG TPA: hypothetical protein VH482_12820 [Thermomicrobiales bacterium]|jgi:hypothetical protein